MARKRSRKNISPAKSGAQQRVAINSAVENGAESRSRSVLVLGIFVLIFCLITVASFIQKSPTWDEPAHLFAGYSYLKWGDFRANPEHPPLAKLLAALPLLARGAAMLLVAQEMVRARGARSNEFGVLVLPVGMELLDAEARMASNEADALDHERSRSNRTKYCFPKSPSMYNSRIFEVGNDL
jgi:hypothetical protein